MFACVAAGRIVPKGDRVERGATTLDDVLARALGSRACEGQRARR
jgi:hypothetical protein